MNMSFNKQILGISGLTILCFLMSSFVVFAQEINDNSTTTSEQPLTESRGENVQEKQNERLEVREQRQETLTEKMERRQEIQTERQASLTVIRQERIINLSANISNRMESAISRLFNIIDRLEKRIQKIKEVGIDTKPAEEKLRESAQQLAEARAKLSNIDSLVVNATTATEPKSQWQVVRQTYIDCGSLIRKSHQSLKETISLLKTASENKENSIVTEEVTEMQSTSTQSE